MEYYFKLCDLISNSTTEEVLEYIKNKNINAKGFHEISKICICSSPLGLAIKHGHPLVVSELINQGFDPTTSCAVDDDVLWLPLNLACECNQTEIILSLRHDHGIDINAVDNDGYTALVRTLLCNKSEKTIDVVKTLLQAGGAVNSSCRYGFTPLSAAIGTEKIDLCRYLILKGADVNARNVDQGNITHLMYGFRQRMHIGIVQLLVESGADINAFDDENMSSLMYALDRNVMIDVHTVQPVSDTQSEPFLVYVPQYGTPAEADVIRLMLQSGADVNASDKEKKSPLMYATANNVGIDVIQLLLEHGADVNALDKNNKSPLCFVFESCHYAEDANAMEETVKLLIKSGADVNSLSIGLASPLRYATMHKASIAVIKLLLDSGVDVNGFDSDKMSSIMYAIKCAAQTDHDVIELLTENGADVNLLNDDLISPLTYAIIRKANIEVIRLLLASGADVNIFDSDNVSSLMYATETPSQADVVKLLMESGAGVNLLNNRLLSTLMYAICRKANIEVIRLLIDSGADVNAIDVDASVLMYAIVSNAELDVIKLLVESGADVNVLNNALVSPLISALANKANIEVIRLLLASGANVNHFDIDDMSSLMYATENPPRIDVIKLLVESGADVNLLNNYLISPLMYAVVKIANIEVIRLLLASGADVNVFDRDNRSSLMYAIEKHAEIDVIKLLLKSGADVNLLNIPNEGHTSPLLYALKCRASVEVLLLFLEAGADVCALDKDGISPLDYVLGNFDDFKHVHGTDVGRINLAQVFAEYVTDMKGVLVKLPGTRDRHEAFDVIRTLCSKGSVTEAKNESGDTVLHHAMYYIRRCSCAESFNLIHFLLVDINLSLWARNIANQTPFLWALMVNEDDVTGFRREITGKILKLCVQVGYRPNSEEMAVVRKIEERYSMVIRGRDVTSLQDICCFSVRRALGRRLPAAVSSLPIPDKLQQRVKLTHIHPMDVPPENSYDCEDSSDDDDTYYFAIC